MQRDACAAHAARLQPGKDAGVEVQRRRRRRHRPRPLREDGLVARRVVGIVGVPDIGRQGHVAMRLEQGERLGRQAQVP
jgi:hypothetical protein